MKIKNEELAKHGTQNAKHEQEAVASRDQAKQREADVEDTEAKAKKQKKSDK